MRRSSGFSLVELLIVVGVLGVLLAIALPSYRNYRISANRAAAKAVLLEVASKQEQFLVQNRADYATSLSDLSVSVPEAISGEYDFTIDTSAPIILSSGASLPAFTASAAPKAGSLQAQAGDGTLSINRFGLKTPANKW